MAYQCAKSVAIPVIGCGGISTTEDIIEYLIAGASAVQIGTATFIEPGIMVRMIGELSAYLEKQNLSGLTELIGSVRDEQAAESLVFMEAAP